jgi:hypothetical protein
MSLFIEDGIGSSVSEDLSSNSTDYETSRSTQSQKRADLAGPGIGSYDSTPSFVCDVTSKII